jgi:hypothetical protein
VSATKNYISAKVYRIPLYFWCHFSLTDIQLNQQKHTKRQDGFQKSGTLMTPEGASDHNAVRPRWLSYG